jgi:hypothetical protein
MVSIKFMAMMDNHTVISREEYFRISADNHSSESPAFLNERQMAMMSPLES